MMPKLRAPAEAARPWFLGCMAAGSAGMFVGQLVHDNYIKILVPIIAMLAYVIAGWAVDKKLLRTMAFADSVYFLGFLFTLVSLSLSLWKFADLDTSDDLVSSVLGSFGIALLTTILGLIFRVTIVNFTPSGEEATIEAEEELSRASRHLARHMDQLSVDMVARNKAYNESLAEVIETTKAALRENAETCRQELVETTEHFATSLRGSSDAFSSVLQGAGQGVADTSSDICKSMRTTEEGLERVLKVASDSIEKSADDFLEHQSSLRERFETLTEHLDTAVRRQQELAGQFGKAQADMQSSMEPLNVSLRALKEGLAGTFKELQSATGLGDNVETVKAHISDLGEQIELAVAAMVALDQEVRAHTDQTGKMRKAQEAELEIIRRLKETLSSDVQSSARDVAKVQDNLVEAATYLRDSLNGRGS